MICFLLNYLDRKPSPNDDKAIGLPQTYESLDGFKEQNGEANTKTHNNKLSAFTNHGFCDNLELNEWTTDRRRAMAVEPRYVEVKPTVALSTISNEPLTESVQKEPEGSYNTEAKRILENPYTKAYF